MDNESSRRELDTPKFRDDRCGDRSGWGPARVCEIFWLPFRPWWTHIKN